MKVLIISDTHGKHENFLKVVEREAPIDLLIHCGDIETGEYTVSAAAECKTEMVLGNNDFFSGLPKERIFELGGKVVWLTHGHTYYVSMNLATLKEEAMHKGADVVMFGHTHKPTLEYGEVLCINPGSISYPRQSDKKASYMICTIENDQWDIKLKYV